MSALKTPNFLADVERQYEWYQANAGGEVADRYLAAVEATSRLLAQYPQLGPRGSFSQLARPRFHRHRQLRRRFLRAHSALGLAAR